MPAYRSHSDQRPESLPASFPAERNCLGKVSSFGIGSNQRVQESGIDPPSQFARLCGQLDGGRFGITRKRAQAWPRGTRPTNCRSRHSHPRGAGPFRNLSVLPHLGQKSLQDNSALRDGWKVGACAFMVSSKSATASGSVPESRRFRDYGKLIDTRVRQLNHLGEIGNRTLRVAFLVAHDTAVGNGKPPSPSARDEPFVIFGERLIEPAFYRKHYLVRSGPHHW